LGLLAWVPPPWHPPPRPPFLSRPCDSTVLPLSGTQSFPLCFQSCNSPQTQKTPGVWPGPVASLQNPWNIIGFGLPSVSPGYFQLPNRVAAQRLFLFVVFIQFLAIFPGTRLYGPFSIGGVWWLGGPPPHLWAVLGRVCWGSYGCLNPSWNSKPRLQQTGHEPTNKIPSLTLEFAALAGLGTRDPL